MIAQNKAYAWQLLALALAGLLLWQTLRLAGAEVAEAKAQQALSAHIATQARQAQAETTKKAGALLAHAGAQQDNTHDFTQELQRLEAVRADDAGRIASLQRNLRATATQHAQAASDLAACRDLADRHQELGELAARSAGVIGRSIDLVQQRDAEVTLLKKQVMTERQVVDKLLQK